MYCVACENSKTSSESQGIITECIIPKFLKINGYLIGPKWFCSENCAKSYYSPAEFEGLTNI